MFANNVQRIVAAATIFFLGIAMADVVRALPQAQSGVQVFEQHCPAAVPNGAKR